MDWSDDRLLRCGPRHGVLAVGKPADLVRPGSGARSRDERDGAAGPVGGFGVNALAEALVGVLVLHNRDNPAQPQP